MKLQIFATMFEVGVGGENVGVGRIKAYLTENEEDAKITYFSKEKKIKDECLKIDLDCDVYGFSMYHNNVEFFIEVINYIRKEKPSAIIFVGSKFATAYYQDILESEELKNVDYVVLGDGEYAINDLLKSIESGKNVQEFVKTHPNIVSRKCDISKVPAVLDINKLPHPDRSWIKEHNYLSAYICDCHGCIGKCSFCAQGNYYRKWNGRDAHDLMDEIISIYRNYGTRHFVFTGGSFEDPGDLGKKRIRTLCNLIEESGYKFSFRYFQRADTFKDNEEDRKLLQLMRRNGFKVALVGIESGNAEDLNLYNKRATVEQNHSTLNLLSEMNIHTEEFGFIMFNPYTTKKKLFENYRFLVEFNACDLFKYTSTVYLHKNTELYNKVKEDGLLTYDRVFYQNFAHKYDFVDEEAKEIWNYVESNICTPEILAMSHSVSDITYYINSFYEFLKDGIKYHDELFDILSVNAEVLKEYFYHLYEETNFKLCTDKYDEFLSNLSNNYNRLIKLKNRLLKQLMLENIIK